MLMKESFKACLRIKHKPFFKNIKITNSTYNYAYKSKSIKKNNRNKKFMLKFKTFKRYYRRIKRFNQILLNQTTKKSFIKAKNKNGKLNKRLYFSTKYMFNRKRKVLSSKEKYLIRLKKRKLNEKKYRKKNIRMLRKVHSFIS